MVQYPIFLLSTHHLFIQKIFWGLAHVISTVIPPGTNHSKVPAPLKMLYNETMKTIARACCCLCFSHLFSNFTWMGLCKYVSPVQCELTSVCLSTRLSLSSASSLQRIPLGPSGRLSCEIEGSWPLSWIVSREEQMPTNLPEIGA